MAFISLLSFLVTFFYPFLPRTREEGGVKEGQLDPLSPRVFSLYLSLFSYSSPCIFYFSLSSGSGDFTRVYSRNTGMPLLLQQYFAMFVKRVLNSWRSPVLTIVQLSIPFVFALLGCLVELSIPDSVTDFDDLTINFSPFGSPKAVLHCKYTKNAYYYFRKPG